MWDLKGYFNATCVGYETVPISYTGTNGVAAYQTTNCVTWAPVPVIETSTGFNGSDCWHWAEDYYRTELMTPVR